MLVLMVALLTTVHQTGGRVTHDLPAKYSAAGNSSISTEQHFHLKIDNEYYRLIETIISLTEFFDQTRITIVTPEDKFKGNIKLSTHISELSDIYSMTKKNSVFLTLFENVTTFQQIMIF